MKRIILLMAQPYRIVNNQTGEIENSGVTMWYYGRDTLKGLLRGEGTERVVHGISPVKANMPYELHKKLNVVPGMYELDMIEEVSIGRDGRAQAKMSVLDIDYIGEIESLNIKAPEKKTPPKVEK